MKFSVFESAAFGYEFEFFIAFKEFPTLGRTLGQFEHHGKSRSPRSTSFRFPMHKVDLDRMIKFIEYIANDGHDAAKSSGDQ